METVNVDYFYCDNQAKEWKAIDIFYFSFFIFNLASHHGGCTFEILAYVVVTRVEEQKFI